MRLFIFAIGGTGSRVLKSLVMLSAAGVKPLDPATGRPYDTFEIIHVIVDPHHANEDLRRTDSLLRDYRKIRSAIHGDSAEASGFFATRIATLRDIAGDAARSLDDSFLFNLADVERRRFSEFIGLNTMREEDRALMEMMFSADELDTRMNIGFVGSPNIGAVALDSFRTSPEFNVFANVLADSDRIFFVSSIFGGTGAAGFPIMVKNIRMAEDLDVANQGLLARAPIGALTVLPYFNLEHRDDSPIDKADFVVKTQSALHYYAETMSHDAADYIYYLGDRVASVPYTNDPGNNGQRNAAHLIELIGALAPLHFASEADPRAQGRAVAFEYGLERDSQTVDFNILGPETRDLIFRPLLKWHLLSLFLDNDFKHCIGRGFTNDSPAIGPDFLSTDFYRTLTSRFMPKYWDWIEEMDANNRHVSLFNLDENTRLDRCVRGIEAKRRFLRGQAFGYDTIFSRINALSRKHSGQFRKKGLPAKLMTLFSEAADHVATERFGLQI